MTVYTHVPSPVGRLLIAADENGLRRVGFPSGSRLGPPEPGWTRIDLTEDAPGSSPRADEADDDLEAIRELAEAARQLSAYFAGTRTDFDLRLSPEGTPFQRTVWLALAEIPYGETISYGELARRVGRPKAARAVGAANGRNPLPIVLPCHRVIGADGTLTGFGGGLDVKRSLLEGESQSWAAASSGASSPVS